MKFHTRAAVALSFLALVFSAVAQTSLANSGASSVSAQVPRLIRFSGVAKDETGKVMSGVVGITFALYKDEQGGAPLWLETQNVQAAATGHYTALLGSATADGVPLSLFSSAEVHWISTQISGQPESARVLLLSVPYALKAADAETLGGLPASAFVQTNFAEAPGSATTAKTANSNSNAPTAAITGSGTADYIPLWTSSSALGNSILYQTGGNIGVATKTPGAKLDTDGTAIAVRGTSSGATGTGVFGDATSTTGVNFGVQGETASTATGAAGVRGYEGATKGQVYGVSGSTSSITNGSTGVIGYEGATTGQVNGVTGTTASSTGNGVFGNATATSGLAFGVNGYSASPSGVGLHGVNTASGGAAIQGFATATSGASFGVSGFSASPSGTGVLATNSSTGEFVNLAGPTPFIIDAHTTTTTLFSVDSSGNGFLDGNLAVKGKLTKGSGSFKIDHPLDPANKYLSHSFVESPDMMNVYNGNITTDRHGLATVTLPDYFEALNQDFRYQLTVIGQFAQAIVKREIENNRFTIKTDKPSVKVSWQVTGIRHDAYADAYRIPVEENKPSQEQGHFLHPELFGASEQQAIGAGLPTPSTADSPTRASLVSPLSEADAPVK